MTVYLEDTYPSALSFKNSQNIIIYYKNQKPTIGLSEISNDGKNYYYSNNVNLIYDGNYNYSSYVSNIK